MRLILLATLATIVAVPANGQTLLDNTLPADAGISLGEVHAAVAKDFRDPASAQYKQLSVIRAWQGGVVICGWVNAKNEFGGYTDFFPFAFASRNGNAYLAENYNDAVSRKLAIMPLQSEGCGTALGLK